MRRELTGEFRSGPAAQEATSAPHSELSCAAPMSLQIGGGALKDMSDKLEN